MQKLETVMRINIFADKAVDAYGVRGKSEIMIGMKPVHNIRFVASVCSSHGGPPTTH